MGVFLKMPVQGMLMETLTTPVTHKLKIMTRSVHVKSGMAMVLMMFIVLLLMVSGIGLLSIGYQSRIFAIRTSQNLACRVCADAGLQKAIDALNTDLIEGTLNDSDLPVSIGETLPGAEGAFSYRIVKNDDGNYIAESVGARAEFRRTIVALLTRQQKALFDFGVLSKKACLLAPGMTAGAYDSQNPSATGLKAQLGTIDTSPSSIVTKPGTIIDGDLFCGVGGDPSKVIINGGTLTGSRFALTNTPQIAQPTVPAFLAVTGKNLSAKGSTITVTPASSGIYGTLSLDSTGKPGKLVVSGGTVTLAVTDFFSLGTNAEIVVDDGSTLLLYVGCNISSANGASISYAGASKDPTHIQIYDTSTGPTASVWALKAKNDWVGVIYAPNSFVTIAASGDIYGAIVGDNVNIKSSSKFWYDVNLKRSANLALNSAAFFTVKHWSESTTGYVPDWAQ